MTITFENDNDVIVYAFDKVISYAKRTQQIFVAQCVWWLASIIGLEQGLVNYIDNIQSRIDVTVVPEKTPEVGRTVSSEPRDNQENQRQDKILEECGKYLKDSKRLREVAALKATGKTLTGRINPSAISKRRLRREDRYLRKPVGLREKGFPKTTGIDQAEIYRRKKAGECLRCAWPSNRKGTHRVSDCKRPIKLDEGTASLPRAKGSSETKQVPQLPPVELAGNESSSFEESSDDSL